MVTITLDVAYDEELGKELELLAAEVPSLTAHVVTLSGPTGWPLVTFTLDEADAGRFAEAYGIELDELLPA